MTHSVLLDTSFFIRLLNDEDSLHQNARDYYKYFLESGLILKTSTITVAEYCTGGSVDELPLMNIQILPFNFDHAKRAGEFARVIFEERNISKVNLKPRAIIPNDSKLFAQADCDKSIQYFVTSDARSLNILKILSKKINPRFEIIDIHLPYHQQFGILDLQ